ncbi:MAG: sigma-70 family RNA polymerase sigma factor [Acidobacteriota bacterium]
MAQPSKKPVTDLLLAWNDGQAAALDELMPLVYAELRRLAQHFLNSERSGHTLESTALVNETYLRLIDQKRVSWRNKAHFFAIAAQQMRRILVDHARTQKAEKRGHGRKLTLGAAAGLGEERDIDLIALDQALEKLAAVDPRQSRMVELRFFGGLTIDETAEVLAVSSATVRREWTMAKAWLYGQVVHRG